MTVHAGRGWRLAPSLIAMEAEADRLAPRRSTASDGSIGDQSHAARKSDHNPEGGWVTALDLTHDPRGGWDAHARARELANRRDPRIDYLISNRQIWTLARGWRPYTGANPHTHHAHTSIFNTATARGITDPFWPGTAYRPPVVVVLPPPPPKEEVVQVRCDVPGLKERGAIFHVVTGSKVRTPVQSQAHVAPLGSITARIEAAPDREVVVTSGAEWDMFVRHWHRVEVDTAV